MLQNQFGRTPLQAAAITFIGPLLGSLIRPVGGKLADRFGGAKVTFVNFIGMVVASGIVLAGSAVESLAIYALGFIVLFVLTGVGNGSTYKMIGAVGALGGGRDTARKHGGLGPVTGADHHGGGRRPFRLVRTRGGHSHDAKKMNRCTER